MFGTRLSDLQYRHLVLEISIICFSIHITSKSNKGTNFAITAQNRSSLYSYNNNISARREIYVLDPKR